MKTTIISPPTSDSVYYNVSHLKTGVKLLIAVFFGFASLLLSPYGISAKMGDIIINVPWTILLPILVSMAFGWRYGLISSLSGGAFFPFLLWPNNGWASLMDSILFLTFFSSIGLVNGMRIKIGKPVLLYRISIILLLSIFMLAFEDLILFNYLLSLNPPFWHQTTISHLDYSILKAILIKDSTSIVFFTLVGKTLLSLPFMRRFFGLEIKSYMKVNSSIFISVLFASILLWFTFYGLDYSLLQTERGFYDGHVLLALFVIVIGSFGSTQIIIYYTERQLLTKDLLTASEYNLKLQFNRMPVACIIWGTDYTIKDWNPAAEKIFGFSNSEIIGKTADETILPKNLNSYLSQLWTTLLHDELDKHSINENLTKDGRTILCDWNNTPLKDNQGNVIGVISMIKDITEEKKVDDALQFLANRGWTSHSENFFNSLAKYLSKLLEVDYVLIARLSETRDTAETIALVANGELIPNITYVLKGTPCDNVVGKEMCIYLKDIQNLFPSDTLLVDMQAESYMGIPLWDSKGNPIGLIAVLNKNQFDNTDIITSVFNIFAISAGAEIERTKSEDALRNSEEKYRSLVDNSPDAIAIYVEGSIVFVNNECLRLMAATSKAELIGKSVIQMVHPDFREWVIERMKKAASENTILPLAEEKFLRLDGSEVDVEVKALPIKFENKMAVQLIVREITERKQSELALKESEKKFRNLIELAADGILIGSHEGVILDANSHFCLMMGKDRDEFIGQPIQSLLFTKESIERAPFRFDLLIKGETVTSERELMWPNGNLITVEMRSKMMPDKTFQAIFTDITERKKAEAILLETKANLTGIIENTTDSIWAINTSYEIIYINNVFMNAYKESFGILLKVGMNFLNAVPEPIRPEWKSRYDRAFNNEQFILEDKIDLGFTTIYIELLGNPILVDEKVIGASFFSRDITERKQAEEALKKSEARFKTVVEAAEEWIREVDNTGIYTYSNHVVEKILGYAPEEIIGKKYFFDFFDPENKLALKESALTAFSQQIPFKDFENTNIHKNGKKVIFKTTGGPIIDDKKNLIGYRGVDIDITERVQMELALKESEEKYRLSFHTSPDSVNINKLDGTYVEINEGFTRTTGYTRDDVMGKSSAEIDIWAIPEDREKLIKGLKEKGMVENLESLFKCKDGRLKTALMSARIVRINNVPHILSITRDITDRVQMETALKESEEKYRLSFLTSPDSVSISKMDGTFIDINESFSKITGYSRDEIIGKTSNDLNLWIYPEDRLDLMKILLNNDIVQNFEWLSRSKTGTINTGLMSAGIININNTPHVLSIVRDITERKELENAIKKSEEQFRLLFERSNNAIFLIDRRDGSYLDANKAAEDLSGYPVTELKKLHTWEITPEGAKNRLSKIAHIKTTIDIGELEYIQPNKSKRYAMLSVVPLNETTVFGIAYDITERKEFEEKLRIFSRAIEQSPVSVIITSTDGKIEYVNPTFTKVTGFSFDEAFGENPRILKSGYTSKKEYEYLWKTIKAGREWSGELCNVKKTGEVFWESAVISPILNEKGTITHFVAVKEEITDRKETDRKILSTIIETEERERNRFSRDLHDGLGPLLSTIKLYFQWLSETDDPDKKKLITEKGDKNLNEAIESIREISNNLSPRTLNTFGIEAAIKNFIDNLNQTQKMSVTFNTNVKNRLDKNIEITLYRIVTELLNNTIKYANATQSEIVLKTDDKVENITLTYRDNGKGFDVNSVQSRSKGFGLMNITQRVNTLSGKMELTSSIGNGFHIKIELPLGKK